MVAILLAEGFEELETTAPIDILLRAGTALKTVGVTGSTVKSKHGISVQTDLTLEQLDAEKLSMLILPGGPGAKILRESDAVDKLVRSCAQRNIYLAAICAAPSVLAVKELLKGRKASCHPSVEQVLKEEGAILSHMPVTIDGKIITSRGAGTALPFALALCTALKGKDKTKEICDAICYGE